MKDKESKFRKRIDDLMADVAEDRLGESTIKKMEETTLKEFKREGIPSSLSHLKAFQKGLELMLMASNQGGRIDFDLVLAMRAVIRKKQAELDKATDEAVKKNENAS